MVPAAGGTPFIWERSHVLTDHVLTDSGLSKSSSPREESKPMAGLIGWVARLSRFGLPAVQNPEVDSPISQPVVLKDCLLGKEHSNSDRQP